MKWINRKTELRRKKPIVARARRPQERHDADYLAWIKTLPCLACYAKWYRKLTIPSAPNGYTLPAEAAHIGLSTSRRGLSQKFPDNESAPLCDVHHRESLQSIHSIGVSAFFDLWGLDRDTTIRFLQKAYEERNVRA